METHGDSGHVLAFSSVFKRPSGKRSSLPTSPWPSASICHVPMQEKPRFEPLRRAPRHLWDGRGVICPPTSASQCAVKAMARVSESKAML